MRGQLTDVKVSDDFGSFKTTNFTRMNVEIIICYLTSELRWEPLWCCSLKWGLMQIYINLAIVN